MEIIIEENKNKSREFNELKNGQVFSTVPYSSPNASQTFFYYYIKIESINTQACMPKNAVRLCNGEICYLSENLIVWPVDAKLIIYHEREKR